MKIEVRKALLEIKEKKENFLLEQKIAEKRIMMIFETRENIINFDNLPKNKKLKLSFQLMQELAQLQRNTLITEEGFFDMLKGLFGGNVFKGLFSSGIETIAEPILDSIFTKIGFKSQGFMKKFIISFLTTNPAELVMAFTDCKKFTKLFTESFVEAIVMLIQDQFNAGSMIFDFARNTLAGYVKNTEFISGIEGQIGEKICSFFDEYTSKTKGLLDRIKPQQTG